MDPTRDAAAGQASAVREPTDAGNGPGSISGTVLDAAGRALRSYRVVASAVDPKPHLLPPRSRTILAADGRFTLERVSRGTYAVEITAPDRVAVRIAPVAVRSQANADLGRIRMSLGGIVRGQVSDRSGAAVRGAKLVLRGGAGLPPREITSGARGEFDFRGMAAGSVEVIVTHARFAPARLAGIEVAPARGPTELRVVLQQGARVEGWVRNRDGAGATDVTVRVTPLDSGAQTSPRGQVARPMADDGAFSVARLPAGPALVVLVARGTPFWQREVDLVDGETTPIEFARQDINVEGRVTCGGAAAIGLRVTFSGRGAFSLVGSGAGDGGEGPPWRSDVTREDGGYELRVDEAGDYRVRIETPAGDVRYPIRAATVPEGESYRLDIELGDTRAAGIVSAIVSGLDGARLWGAAFFKADAEGVIDVPVPAGSVEVRVTVAHDSAHASLDVLPGHTSFTDIVLAVEKAP